MEKLAIGLTLIGILNFLILLIVNYWISLEQGNLFTAMLKGLLRWLKWIVKPFIIRKDNWRQLVIKVNWNAKESTQKKDISKPAA